MMPKIVHTESKQLFDTLIQHEQVRGFFGSLRRHHRDTYEHSLRVGLLSIDLGYDNRLGGMDLRYLGYAGLLHDAEKVRIPIELLSKDTGFDTTEKEIIRQHPRLAFQKLRNFEYDVVREIVVAHHEYKRDPYPRKGADRRQNSRLTPDRRIGKSRVPLLAQLIAVADMFDALSSDRSYKKPLTKRTTERILRHQFTGDHKHVDQVLLRYNS